MEMQSATPEIPQYGGMLCLGGATAGCPRCGWRGVPTYLAGVPQTECPACEMPEELELPVKVSRNAPCPCGSGKKAKKCHYR